MRSTDSSLVRELGLFAGMTDSDFEELAQAAFLQRFPAQVRLIAEGDPADFLYIVLDGGVELFAGANSRETSIEIVRPVSTFALASVLQDVAYLLSGRTTEDSLILMIPAESVRTAFDKDAAFARAAVRELSGRYRAMVKSLKNHKLRTAVERLANYLLNLSAEQGDSSLAVLQIDKRTLAALLGMTPENLSRAFASLKPYGVEVNGREIRLTKAGELRELARPSALIDDPRS